MKNICLYRIRCANDDLFICIIIFEGCLFVLLCINKKYGDYLQWKPINLVLPKSRNRAVYQGFITGKTNDLINPRVPIMNYLKFREEKKNDDHQTSDYKYMLNANK